MPGDQVFEGRELEEAIAAAAAATGIPEADLHYQIVEQGRRGLFGLGARSVRIRLIESGAAPEPSAAPPPGRAEHRAATKAAHPDPPATRPVSADAADVQRTLQRMIDLMGLDLRVKAEMAGAGLDLVLVGPDRKMLAQKDGELQSALQFLINRMARRAWPDVGPIQVGIDGKRPRRDDEIVDKIRDIAEQVVRTGKPSRLEPMNAYERRLVHLTVREYEGLGSRSEGNGPFKRVSIYKQPRS